MNLPQRLEMLGFVAWQHMPEFVFHSFHCLIREHVCLLRKPTIACGMCRLLSVCGLYHSCLAAVTLMNEVTHCQTIILI